MLLCACDFLTATLEVMFVVLYLPGGRYTLQISEEVIGRLLQVKQALSVYIYTRLSVLLHPFFYIYFLSDWPNRACTK